MDLSDKIRDLQQKKTANKRYLHSPAHLLADELSKTFGDLKHFGAYLKLALKHNHDWLRKIAKEVQEQKNVQSPAKLFMYLVKKGSQEK